MHATTSRRHLALGGAYTYTDVKGSCRVRVTAITSQYHQFGLQADYSLSKRTDIYAEGVVQFTASDGRYANVYGTASVVRAATRSSCRRVSVTASKAT